MPRKLVRRFVHRFVELCALSGLILVLFQYPSTRLLLNLEGTSKIKYQRMHKSSKASDTATADERLHVGGSVVLPASRRPLSSRGSQEEPDFGGLELSFLLQSKNTTRTAFSPRDDEIHKRDRIALLELMDQEQPWELSANWLKNEDQIVAETGQPADCQAPNWRSLMFPTCNTVHESTSNVLEKKVLGAGTSRMGWLVTSPQRDQHDEEFVLKQLILHSKSRTNNDPTDKHLLKNQRETLIMERLTASPRVVEIYGACGTSSLVEAMVGDIMSDADLWESQGQKKQLSNAKKLDLAIIMAETIADMHGFEDGLIFNTDLSLVQFLVAKDGKIKLNDFNSAFIPGWNHSQGQYCKIQREKWNPTRYPPEVILGNDLDEAVDVFAYGDMLAFLWTGASPIFGPRIPPGQPYKFTRHAADARYIERQEQDIITDTFEQLMQSSWEFKPSNRPDIFQILQSLKETRERYQQQGFVGRIADRFRRKCWCLLICALLRSLISR